MKSNYKKITHISLIYLKLYPAKYVLVNKTLTVGRELN